MTHRSVWLAVLLMAEIQSTSMRASEPVQPLPRAHAHNDYEHARPLLDALDRGFCSVEADIYLVGDQLLVAHDRSKVRPDRTLQALYLDPLRARVRQNGGRVFKDGPTIVLLIDIKSDADETYAAFRDVLGSYAGMLTRFGGTSIETNAVTVIISGNRARKLIATDPVRYAAVDGRPEDLGGPDPASLVPLISADWKGLFTWRGTGSFPDNERLRLRELILRAHQEGRRVRFWGTPDRREIWQQLLACDVDLLNADDLSGLRDYLLSR